MQRITFVDHTSDLGGEANWCSLEQAAGQAYRPGVELGFLMASWAVVMGRSVRGCAAVGASDWVKLATRPERQ